MPMDQAILEHEAMRLPPKDRALLADALLGSLDDDAAREVEASWTAEAEERLAAYRRGDLNAVDGPAALRELRERQKQ
jgi:putative addiction module component (TIGR02574 family)